MAATDVTFDSKNEILDEHSVTLLRRITLTPMFMAHLVAAHILTGDEAEDIGAIQSPGEQRQALITHLRHQSVEAFLAFCIVLVDKNDRYDIIEQFGLDINLVKRQKREIELERELSSQQYQPAAPVQRNDRMWEQPRVKQPEPAQRRPVQQILEEPQNQPPNTAHRNDQMWEQPKVKQPEPVRQRPEVPEKQPPDGGHERYKKQEQSKDVQTQCEEEIKDKKEEQPKGGASAAPTCPVWDKKNPDEQQILRKTPLYTCVKSNYNDLVENVRLDNLWPKFQSYNLVNKRTEQRIKAERTDCDRVYKLLEVLEMSPTWRFHAMLKALCEDDQECCVTMLGLDAADYTTE